MGHETVNQKWVPPLYAVANVRKDKKGEEDLDYFPTPAWGTRALLHMFSPFMREVFKTQTVLEPACGAGHMSRPLGEYFKEVVSCDIHDHGYPGTIIGDYLKLAQDSQQFDWVITNPPFKLAQEFIIKSLSLATTGVAMLTRTSFLESSGRYEKLFNPYPPSDVFQFAERLPMVKNRVDKKASTATSYCWIVWLNESGPGTRMNWIPPCRKELEKDSDYDS